MPTIAPGTEEDLIWNWAGAEIDSPRFSALYDRINPQLKDLVIQGKRGELSAADWQSISQVVKNSRSPLLKGLLRLGTTWFICSFQSSEILEFKIMWPPFVAIARSRSLADFVRALDAGQVPPNDDFLPVYQKRRADFSVNKMRGYPVMVSARQEGPYMVLEGYTRLSVLTSKLLKNELASFDVQIILGICSRIDEWYLNDNRDQWRLG